MPLANEGVRTESVASSKIEQVVASAGDYALALAGSRANSSAVNLVAAPAALSGRLVTIAGVVAEIAGRKRDLVWAAADALGELEDWTAASTRGRPRTRHDGGSTMAGGRESWLCAATAA